MEIAVLKSDGTDSGRKCILNDEVFGIEPHNIAMFEDSRLYLANRRQGTHKTKTRWEVKGSTRKLFRQKGTGNARRGSLRSPLLRGGGTLHGPVPRDYSFKLNKRVSILARKSALSAKAKASEIMVVEDFTFQEPSTREIKNIISSLNLDGKKVLLLTSGGNKNVHLSARNLEKVRVLEAVNANTYQILNADMVVLQESAVNAIQNILNRKISRGAEA
jgi:large subunit ribosomal protein L4